jgi:hypothetical protein
MKRALIIAVATTTLLAGVGLVHAQPGIGWLDVAAQPDDGKPVAAAIILDDAGLHDDKGHALTTPQTHLPLAAGHHNLVLVAPDGKSSHIGFSIQAGKTTSFTLHPH